MAGDLRYKVSGSYDNKAIKEASNGIQQLADKAKQLTNVLKAVAGAYAIKKGFDFVNKSISLYGEQEKSVLRLNTAIQNNSNLTKESSKRLQEQASAMQKNSVYGDEQIIQQQALLASMGMTESQMGSVMQASIDLASSGVMPLESAVKNISKSYSGMTGELGESIPALKELTTEQLKAGEGVELISKMYAGMGKNLSLGIEGQKQQMRNIFGDIMETLGSTFIPLANNIMGALKPIIETFAKWMNDNSTQITNFFTNIPTLASMTFKSIIDVFNQYFTADFWNKNGSAMWVAWGETFKGALDFVWSLVKSIGTTLWEPLKFGFEVIMWGIKEIFYGIIDWFEEKINGLGRLASNIGKVFTPKKYEKDYVDFKIGGDRTNDKPQNNIKENIADSWGETGSVGLKLVSTIGTAFKETGIVLATPMVDAFKNLMPEFKTILDAPLATPPPLSLGLEANTTKGGVSSTGGSSFMDTITGSFDSFVGGINGTLSSLTSIKAILDPLNIIFQSMLNVLTPVIDAVLAPVLNALSTIGAVIGGFIAPILIQLTPVMDILGQLLIVVTDVIMIALAPAFSVLSTILTLLNPLFKGLAVVIEIVSAPIKFLADLFMWVGDQISVAVNNLVERIKHPFSGGNQRNGSSFSSDAFTGLGDRIAAIWNTNTPGSATTLTDINNNIDGFGDGFTYGGSGYSDSSSSSSSSTVTQVPDVYFYTTIEGNLVGEDGMEKLANKIFEIGRESGSLSGSANIIVA